MTTRIFCPGELSVGATIALEMDAAKHVRRVLRLTEGDTLTVFNGDGCDYTAVIASIARDDVRVRVRSGNVVNTESPLSITLIQGICRAQRMDWLVQKSTELGVTQILPALCERSVVKLDKKRSQSKREHWRKVAESACEQCGRARVPHIGDPTRLPALMDEAAASADTKLLLDPDGDRTIAGAFDGTAALIMLVGPEGGLTQDERRFATEAGFLGIRLGRRTLRTETAPIAALSVIQYLAGDLC